MKVVVPWKIQLILRCIRLSENWNDGNVCMPSLLWWRCYVFGFCLSVHVFLLGHYLISIIPVLNWGEFCQIFSFGAFGNKGELLRFWG